MEARAEGPPGCSCGRDIVQFECIVSDCTSHQVQKHYCVVCLMEHKNHAHPAEKISNVQFISEVEKRWSEVNDKYAKIFSIAREKFKPLKNLINFLTTVTEG